MRKDPGKISSNGCEAVITSVTVVADKNLQNNSKKSCICGNFP
jgi:hypothetical protein